MATIAELLKQSELKESDSATLDAQLLLGHVLGRNRTYLYTWPDRQVPDPECDRYFALLARRRKGEPVAYLLGRQEFWSLPLKVSAATLIPRGDTESLVEHVLRLPLPENARVLDLGTGTGAIALALAHERPHWQLMAVDKQSEAVELARENAEALGLTRVDIVQSSWFDKVSGTFDLIVSNPPYIESSDPHLNQGDVRFEPRSALVADHGGLADIEHIVRGSSHYLKPGGYLYLEHGLDQGEAVRGLLATAGFENCETIQDLAARDRVTGARWRASDHPQ